MRFLAVFQKQKDGLLRIKVTTDRKFNILSTETEESKENIDYSPLVSFLAEKYIEINGR